MSPEGNVDRIGVMATRNRQDAQRVQTFVHPRSEPRQPETSGDLKETGTKRPGSLDVRPFLFLDSRMMRLFDTRVELRLPESAFDQPGAMRLALRRLLAAETSTQPLYVAVDQTSGTRIGALQCLQQSADDRWHLQFLAFQSGIDAAWQVPVALLEHATREAGIRGARRILAKIGTRSAIVPALLSVGFTTYSQEQVFLIADDTPVTYLKGVRAQTKSDVWSVHQLYLQTTPRDVQNAEALTSHAWDVDSEGRSQRGWFIANDRGIGAYIRVRTTRQYHVLDTMVASENRNDLTELLSSVVAILKTESPRQMFLTLRGYQADLQNVILEFVTDPIIEQLLTVKYTTATAPASIRVAESFELLRTVESDPKRVPSFCVKEIHEQC